MSTAGAIAVSGHKERRVLSASSQRLLEAFEVPFFLFTPDAAVAWLNAPARGLLDRMGLSLNADGIICSAGVLSRKVDASQVRLREAFRAVCGWKGGWTEIALPGLPNTQLQLYRLVLDGESYVACVPTPKRRYERPRPRLTAYGLTETERKIAGQLVKGQSVSEIASQSGNTILTIRTHVKHIYSKIGVNTRAQMIAQLIGL